MCRNFGTLLAEKLKEGSICSPKCVYDELLGYKDRLSTRAKARKTDEMCILLDPEVQKHMGTIGDHVEAKYPRHKGAEFLAAADPWVIACALRLGGTVVTQESTRRRTKIRIPTVCLEFKVPCTDTFKMLDWFEAKFWDETGNRK